MRQRPRVIASILLIDYLAYSFQDFCRYEYVGDPINIVSILSGYEIDELLLVNKTSIIQSKSFCSQLQAIRQIADFPLAFTGGIRNIDDAKTIMRLGFDKIYLSKFSPYERNLPTLIKNCFGQQAIGLSIDYIKTNGQRLLYDSSRRTCTDFDLRSFLSNLNQNLYSDIILTCVNNTGTGSGLDGEVLNTLRGLRLNNPIVISGGLKDATDIVKVMSEYDHPHFSGVMGSSSLFLQSGSGSALICIERFNMEEKP